jgi:hypothetical protein
VESGWVLTHNPGTKANLGIERNTYAHILELVSEEHLLNNTVCFGVYLFDFAQELKVLLVVRSDISVHIAEQEYIIVKEDSLTLLHTHLFNLECILVNFP